ncbi:hypothetical protein MCP_1276 [Methanocella paludicola SANAE]|uniref:Uncharacterized protein n=1 Tax=Methanocella paludicola (strain DSM 17711 / JCM 13418 / NBRC 101707 / SANAE) TaxID=304371 RepID=D1YY26_METPS|nr:hypothetical protein [Methanocella paludicola]BAI61348.1 hypothetical protein MCP_1276 [Methanocella paludicola SANAE]
MRGLTVTFILLAIATMLVYAAVPALASNNHTPTTGYGSNIQPGSQPDAQNTQAPPGQPNDNGNQYGSGGPENNGQAGYGNLSRMNFSGLSYGEWQKWASTYRSGPKYNYSFSISGADGLTGKNASMNGQKWFNESWGSGHSDVSKKIARLRITTLLREMDMLKLMVNGSGLSTNEQAAIARGIDSNVQWLNSMDQEIQAANDMKSLGQAIAKAEPALAMIRSEVKANAGLMACKNMDARIEIAMNVSDMINEKALGLTAEEKAWYAQELAGYDQHIYDVCRYQVNAREAFGKYSETRDDAYYIDGLRQIELAQNELYQAFDILGDIFDRM